MQRRKNNDCKGLNEPKPLSVLSHFRQLLKEGGWPASGLLAPRVLPLEGAWENREGTDDTAQDLHATSAFYYLCDLGRLSWANCNFFIWEREIIIHGFLD